MLFKEQFCFTVQKSQTSFFRLKENVQFSCIASCVRNMIEKIKKSLICFAENIFIKASLLGQYGFVNKIMMCIF